MRCFRSNLNVSNKCSRAFDHEFSLELEPFGDVEDHYVVLIERRERMKQAGESA